MAVTRTEGTTMSAFTKSIPALLGVAAQVACSKAPTEPADEISLLTRARWRA